MKQKEDRFSKERVSVVLLPVAHEMGKDVYASILYVPDTGCCLKAQDYFIECGMPIRQ